MDEKNSQKKRKIIIYIISVVVLIVLCVVIVLSVKTCNKNNDIKDNRVNYISEVSSYVNLDDYNDEEKILISKIIKEAEDSINVTKSSEEMKKIVSKAKEKISSYKTKKEYDDEDALETARASKIAEIGSIARAYKEADYRETEWNNIKAAVQNAIDDINMSDNKDAILNYSLDNLKNVLKNQKTDKELTAEELAAAKTSKINDINELASKYPEDNYFEEELAERTKIIQSAIDEVNNFTNINDVDNYSLDSLKSSLDNLNTKDYYKKVTLDETLFTIDLTDKTYIGELITVGVESSTYTQGVDYTIEYTNNVNVGTATLKIVPIGNTYKYGFTKTFNIVAKAIESSIFGVSVTDETYTGSAITKDITTTLTVNKDYTIEYTNNINVGEVTITITGQGNYKSSLTYKFNIVAKTIDKNMFNSIESLTYTGNALTPSLSSETLTDSDYTVEYSDNINVGTAKVTITAKGNFTGSVQLTFTITAKDISDIEFTTFGRDYNGSELYPTKIEASYNNKDLQLNNDFEITGASNNIKPSSNAVVTIKGIGNYTGTKDLTFVIYTTSVSDLDFTLSTTSFEYTGDEITPEVTKPEGYIFDSTNKYIVTYSNNINVGIATVTITGYGNYSAGEIKKLTFNITEKTLTKEMFKTISSQKYTSSAIEPTIEVETSYSLTKGVDYTVEYSENINVGNAKVTITGIGNYTGTVNLTFNIKDTEPLESKMFKSISDQVYTASVIKPSIEVASGYSLTEGQDYTVSYDTNAINLGQYDITITGKGNYEGSLNISFKIVGKIKMVYSNGIYYVDGLNDTTLTTLDIPATYNDGINGSKNVEYINAGAFTNNTTITSVTIGANVKEIKDGTNSTGAFANCSKLITLNILSTEIIIGEYSFYNCTSLKTTNFTNVKQISPYSFGSCTSLTSIDFGNGGDTISDLAFYNCTSLTSVKAKPSAGLISITGAAFRGCTKLTTLYLLSSKIKLQTTAFNGCSSIKYIYYGDSEVNFNNSNYVYNENNKTPTNVSSYKIYYYCSADPTENDRLWRYVSNIPTIWTNVLEFHYKLNDDNKSYYIYCNGSSNANGGCGDSSHTNEGMGGQTKYVIPATYKGLPVTKINDASLTQIDTLKSVDFSRAVNLETIGSAFRACRNLSSIDFSGATNLKTIGNKAFMGCSSITSIDLSKTKVETVGIDSFSGCDKLTSIKLPETLTGIKTRAFTGDTALKDIYLGVKLTYIGWNAFVYSDISTGGNSQDIPNIKFHFSSNNITLSNIKYYDAGTTSSDYGTNYISFTNSSFYQKSSFVYNWN